MQGQILSAAVTSNQGVILGDDGARYTFMPEAWRDPSVRAWVGMRVTFEARGIHVEEVYPLFGADAGVNINIPLTAPPIQHRQVSQAPLVNPTAPVTTAETPPADPAATESPPIGQLKTGQNFSKFGKSRWLTGIDKSRALMMAAIIMIVVLIAIGGATTFYLLGIEKPIGRELARHTYVGDIYILVEYEEDLAVFTESGTPVTDRNRADRVLHSYAWKPVVDSIDYSGVAQTVLTVQKIDSSITDVRSLSNQAVDVLERLEGIGASIPVMGRVSAIDVVKRTYPGVGTAEESIRSFDSELNKWGVNTDELVGSTNRIVELSESGDLEGNNLVGLFTDVSSSAQGIASTVSAIKGKVSEVEGYARSLEAALDDASDTRFIGGAIGSLASPVGRFRGELRTLASTLGTFESDLTQIHSQFQGGLNAAASAHEGYMLRWLDEPHDPQWPPTDPERRPVMQHEPSVEDTPPNEQSFTLDTSLSQTSVEVGESVTLTVLMRDVQGGGEHGGISVSFQDITDAAGGSKLANHKYAAPNVADVELVGEQTSVSNIRFYEPGEGIFHRRDQTEREPAEYLLVESDDVSWPEGSKRALALRITPKQPGPFKILVLGWICADEYLDCSREPAIDSVTDQQGWPAEEITVSVISDALPPVAKHLRIVSDNPSWSQ